MALENRTLTGEAPRSPLPRTFTFILATGAAEGFGDALTRTLLPILAVTVLGLGTGFVGILNSIGLASFLLLGMPIGLLIDRLRNRTRVMGLATLTRCLALTGLATSYFVGWLSGPLLISIAIILGIADLVFTTAQSTVIPAVVSSSQLKLAYSRLSIVDQGSSTAASALGSLILGLLGIPGMLCASICSYVGSLLFQCGVTTKAAQPSPSPRGRNRKNFRDSFETLYKIPALWALTVSAALTNAGAMLANTVLPVFILRDLKIAPELFAALGIISALGAICGAALTPRLSIRFGLRTLRIATALLGVPAVVLAIACQQLPGSPLIWLALQSVSWSFLISVSAVAGAEVLPKTVPAEKLATIGAAQRTITLGIMPISALIGGTIATLVGPTPLLWFWAILAGLSALPIIRERSLTALR